MPLTLSLIFGGLFGQTVLAEAPLNCRVEVPGIEAMSMPVVYDGLQKSYELIFVLREGEAGQMTAQTYRPEDFSAAFDQAVSEKFEAIRKKIKPLPVVSPILTFFAQQNARERVAKSFSIAEVRVLSDKGQISLSTPVRLTLGNSLYRGVESFSSRMVYTQAYGANPKGDFYAHFVKANGALAPVKAQITCSFETLSKAQ